MKGIIRFVKKLFGKYETGHEYWIYTKDIKVNPEWRNFMIGRKKWKRKLTYWRKLGIFESKVILDHDFNLLDGYSTVKICEKNGIDKMPVYFVDRTA